MLARDPPRIGPYTVLRPLGMGGMAVVYLCERQGIGGFRKQVVIKLIRPEHASDHEFVLMFLDEARMSATLSHPNLVQVFEVETVGGAPYIVMEFVNGPSLARLADRALDAMHYGHVACVVGAIARGLHHAHFGDGPSGPGVAARLVHRDVSLQNILVAADGTPKLIDFGIAKAEGRLQQTGTGWKGQLAYLPPEQVRGEGADHRGDIFALGVCLYRATTGRMPFSGDTVADSMARVVAGSATAPSSLVPSYPPALERIVLRALAGPLDRYQTASAMAAELEEFCAAGAWTSDHRAVAAWIRHLFPLGADEWLARPPGEVAPTPTPSSSSSASFSRTSGTLDPGKLVVRSPQVRSGLVFIGLVAFVTMIGASALLLVTVALVFVQARMAAPEPFGAPPAADQAAGPANADPERVDPAAELPGAAPPGADAGATDAAPADAGATDGWLGATGGDGAAHPLPAGPPGSPSGTASSGTASSGTSPSGTSPSGSSQPGSPRSGSPSGAASAGSSPSGLQPESSRPGSAGPAPGSSGTGEPAGAPSDLARTGPSAPSGPTLAPDLAVQAPPTEVAPAPAPASAVGPARVTFDRSVGGALPADYTIRNIAQIKVVLSAIEEHAVKAGVSPSVARGSTAPLAEALVDGWSPGGTMEVHPRAIFDRIVDDAEQGRSGGEIGADLKRAHLRGTLK